MTRPIVKPIRPEFSSGPCAKRPNWSLDVLKDSCLGRSHRHPLAKNKLRKAIELTKSILEIPEDYLVGIVPGSDTGAIEMAMWNLLGPLHVNILAWDSFGQDWANDINTQLKLKNIDKDKKAWMLIKKAGCENFQEGDAIISKKHCNFFVNNGKAKSSDIENLIKRVKETVYTKTGVNLELEIKIIGE